MLSDWRVDPDGNEYQIDYTNQKVEYKPKNYPEPTTFKHFLVKVKGETYHVQAEDAERAARHFWSDSLPSLPTRSEVEVTPE